MLKSKTSRENTLDGSTLVFFICISIALITCSYAILVGNDVPLGDHWRWIKYLLIPYSRGEISLLHYMFGQYKFLSHSHFLALAFLLLSYKEFSLSFYPQLVFGMVFYIAGYLLIARRVLSFRESNFTNNLGMVAFTAAYFIITTDFPWFLVVFEYSYLFLSLLLFVAFDFYAQGKLASWIYFLLFGVVLFCADAIGFTAVISVISVSFVMCIINALPWRKFLNLLVLFLVIAFFQFVVFHSLTPTSAVSSGGGLLANEPALIAKSLGIVFVQPIIDNAVLKDMIGANSVQVRYLIAVFILLAGLSSMFFYFKDRLYHKTTLPFVMTVFSAVAWLGILWGRMGTFGIEVFFVHRYVRLFSVGLMGVIIAAVMLSHRRKLMLVANSLFIVVIGFYFIAAQHQWKYIKSVQQYTKEAEQLILTYDPNTHSEELSDYVPECPNHFCDEAIKFMRDNKLNVFSRMTHTSVNQPLRLIEIGPIETKAGKDFNIQPDGRSAIWAKTENATMTTVIVWDKVQLKTVFGGEQLLTASVPKELYSKPGQFQIYLLDTRTGAKSKQSVVMTVE